MLIGLLGDYLNFEGLQHTLIEIAEPLTLSQYVFAIFIAFAIFPDGMNILPLILALAGVSVLIGMDIEKHHLRLHRHSLSIITGAFFYTVPKNLMKYLFLFFSPFLLLFLLPTLDDVLLFPLSKPCCADISRKDIRKIWIYTSIFDIGCFVKVCFSYSTIGLITTSLIMVLALHFAGWLATLYLKETLHWKKFVATSLILVFISINFRI